MLVGQKNCKLLSFIILLFILIGCNDNNINNSTPPLIDNKKENHPILLLKEGEEDKIELLIQKYPQMSLAHKYIIDYADKCLDMKPVERVLNGKRLLKISREALTRIYYLSYAYRMTGKEEYASRAEIELLAVCGFSDWNPNHFLDVAEMTMGVAIGYDWLYNYLSESSRKIIHKAIVEKAFVPANDPKKATFYNATNNWNQVCNAGLVFGALALYEREPEISSNIIDKAIKTIPLAMESYHPDGAYPEGFTYWGYGTGFEVAMLEAMKTSLGTDFGLSNDNAFMQSPMFMLFLTTPTGWCYNFGDSGKTINFEHGMYWFAKELKDPSLLVYELKYLENLKKYGGNENDRLLPNVLIFSKDLNLDNIEPPSENFWISEGNKPLYVWRSGWTDKKDTYLGVVGGAANISHGHMDAGSFLYEKNGVRWSMELGLQSYETLESKGVDLWNMSQNSQRWDVFRLGNTGHSTLVVNNERHLVNAAPQFVENYNTDDLKGVTIDLSSLYSGNINKVFRTVALNKANDLFVNDKIITNNKSADIKWMMVTPAEAKIVSTNEIELTSNGHKMILSIDSPIDVKVNIWDNNPVHDYDQENPGTCRVGYTTTLPSNNVYQINVTLSTLE